MTLVPALLSAVALAAAPGMARAAEKEAPRKVEDLLSGIQQGDPGLKSIGRISMGPAGVLLIADHAGASIVGISTGDTGPLRRLEQPVEDVLDKVAGVLGAEPGTVSIVDMAVNPASGKVYFSTHRKEGNQYAIVTVAADGNFDVLDLSDANYVRVALPGGEQTKVRNVSGVSFAEDRVLAAGQNNEEFSSKIFSLPLPLKHGDTASAWSTETYHVAHGRWETRAPIQSFIPYQEKGENFLVGSFACTPIAKFPLDDIEAGAKVQGTSVVELGSGNRPLDMFTYTRDGKEWLVTNTYRFHFKKNKYGPSKWWGVRVSMDYLAEQEKVNEEAARRDVKQKAGPNGIEVLEALSGAMEVGKLSNDDMVVLRAVNDDEQKLRLEIAPLP
ncbi:MAG: hypothetical protein KDA79_02535 [Planctomycetaceae bacterium]|nr:hypothetical protein [Planctomycetaceae bacterium]